MRRKYEFDKEANEKFKEKQRKRKIYELKKKRHMETDEEVAMFLLEQIERIGYELDKWGFLNESPHKDEIKYREMLKIIESLDFSKLEK